MASRRPTAGNMILYVVIYVLVQAAIIAILAGVIDIIK